MYRDAHLKERARLERALAIVKEDEEIHRTLSLGYMNEAGYYRARTERLESFCLLVIAPAVLAFMFLLSLFSLT